MNRWKCRKCWYVYDPRVGDPDGGIPPNTPFEKIPADWRCPVCGASKRDFHVVQAGPLPAPAGPPAAQLPTPAAQLPTPAAPSTAAPVHATASARAASLPIWTVGSLKGLRQGDD